MSLTPLSIILALVLAWFAVGLLGLIAPRNVAWVGRTLFPLGAAMGLAMAVAAVLAIFGATETRILAIGLPDLPMHLRLDALSAFFLALIGVTTTGISLFAAGYFRGGDGTAPGLMGLQYHVFLASMAMVVLADDAFAFMVAWETMALSSYFLVTTQHRVPEVQSAGFLYLLLAHIGAISLLLCFGVLQGGSWQFTFDAMRAADLAPAWASVAFGLALFGFGAKAGLLPLHVWLPEAHPAAPSPVSALMSGVMLKTAIYGMVRVSFDLLPHTQWRWGVVVMVVGGLTGLFGAVFAAVQSDMKRLLAYSSIENIGLIFSGLGLALLFRGMGMGTLSALALAATLYHCLNHAQFKSLLFLVTGSVMHATGERSLGKLGGLLRHMPWVAGMALIGTLAMAGLPPLNGFVSEWLLLQSYLLTPSLPHTLINMLAPLGVAVFALTTALASYVLVKFFGVIFLGQSREPTAPPARDAGLLERAGLIWLAATSVLLGLLPVLVLRALDRVNLELIGSSLGERAATWWSVMPLSSERASYSPLALGIGILVCVALTFLLVRRLYHGRIRLCTPWGCGYPQWTPRMQDTAEGFGQPIRRVFEPFFEVQRQTPTAFDSAPKYRVVVTDRWWGLIYAPIIRLVQMLSRWVSFLQQGNISLYLLYSFATLLTLLAFVL
ncbi:MAG: hydrogenase 4 subunit B [Lysobacterales bacterium CG02_land_8_20_14_3_00_62_12]|nr:MAG: hydrogenase 4 subunit B [Xanthomonadales bacterium CG02_land_8_20_14_3_00_62_12]